jgi:MYXO-CTERM domain-containing protein
VCAEAGKDAADKDEGGDSEWVVPVSVTVAGLVLLAGLLAAVWRRRASDDDVEESRAAGKAHSDAEAATVRCLNDTEMQMHAAHA